MDDLRSRLQHLDRIEVLDMIGGGSFGKVYRIRDPDDGREYAAKTEPLTACPAQLPLEWKIYQKMLGAPGFPVAYAMWHSGGLRWLAMDVLGPSLEKCRPKISERDVMEWIAPKTLDAIEALHSRDLLHRDIKPDNILTGPAGLASREVYLVDFGLSKRYRWADTSSHIAYRDGKRMAGTVRYASVHTHLGEEQSRRDDLESLIYVYVFLITKRLPWMNSGGGTKEEEYKRIMRCKLKTAPEELCKTVPAPLLQCLRHVRALDFEQAPDYALMRSYFPSPAESGE